MKCFNLIGAFVLVLLFVNEDVYVGAFFDFGASVGLGLGAAGLYAGYEFVKCKYKECCNPQWIKLDIHGIAEDFNKHLYGQHLVEQIVVKALRAHFRRNPAKPLVMSFHGWTGGGKNYVSSLIANNIYKEGSKSKFVHWFISTKHFKHADSVDRYKDDLQRWIQGNVSECGISLFIFDEVDKMPVGVMDAVKPFIDYYEEIEGVDFRKSVFIFLSNTGGPQITDKMLQHLSEGKNRLDMEYFDLEELILRGAFNEKGGLLHASMIEKSLIDYYVPFLPLEKKHVEKCVIDDLDKKGYSLERLGPGFVQKIVENMPFAPSDTKLFSKVGCKRVSEKVNFYLDELEEERNQLY